MTKQLSIFLQIVYTFLAIIAVSLFFTLASRCFYSDSEIWLLTLSQNIFHVGELTSIYYKWLFHLFTYVFSHFAPNEYSVYLWARYGWASISIISVIIISVTMSKVFKLKHFVLPSLIMVITSSIFYNQGFRIRADMLTLFFHSISLYFLLIARSKQITKLDITLCTFLNCCLLLTTPKAVYFWLCQFVVGIALNKSKDVPYNNHYLTFIFSSHLLPIILGAWFILMNAIMPFSEINLSYIIATAVNFFLKTYDTELANPDYFSLTSFVYVISFISKNVLHALIIYLFILITLVTFISKPKKFWFHWSDIKSFQLYSLLLLVLTLTHNHKLPFFLAVCLTPILIFSFYFLYSLILKYPAYIYKPIPLMCCLYGIQVSSSHMKLNIFNNNNYQQKQAILRLEEYVKKFPQLRIYDVIGILPRKTKVFGFTGPSEVSKKFNTMKKIIKQKPNLVILTHKTSFLEPQLKHYLEESMIQIETGIWAKGKKINPIIKPQAFSQLKVINNAAYWIFPAISNHYVYDLHTKKIINDEILHLNSSYLTINTDKQKSSYLAIPKKYFDIGFSEFEQPNFPQSPYYLFRFDTGF